MSHQFLHQSWDNISAVTSCFILSVPFPLLQPAEEKKYVSQIVTRCLFPVIVLTGHYDTLFIYTQTNSAGIHTSHNSYRGNRQRIIKSLKAELRENRKKKYIFVWGKWGGEVRTQQDLHLQKSEWSLLCSLEIWDKIVNINHPKYSSSPQIWSRKFNSEKILNYELSLVWENSFLVIGLQTFFVHILHGYWFSRMTRSLATAEKE